MWNRRILAAVILFTCCCLLYSFQSYLRLRTNSSSTVRNNTSIRHKHNAIILTRRPSVRVLKHLNALVRAGVNAFAICDEDPSEYTSVVKRILFVNNATLEQYGLTTNQVWDRVFVWLYNQTSIDYVWLMEDDLTWTNVRHMVNLFDQYANDSTDLLARTLLHKNDQTLGWLGWPKTHLEFFPEDKWAGSLTMLSRVSSRLVQAHQHYARLLFRERQKNSSLEIESKYYYQEFFTPTVARLSNLSIVVYDHSKMNVHAFVLSEDQIRGSLENGMQIFHAVKHDSQLLINATRN